MRGGVFCLRLRRAAPERRASNAQHMTEVAATDEVDVGYTLHDRRCGRCRSPSPAAACVIPCFQFSMLLHNLSSVFSLNKKSSAPCAAPASRTARPPQRASQKRPPHPHRPKARSRLGPTKSPCRTRTSPPVGTAPCSAAPGRRQNRRLPHRIHALARRSCPPLRPAGPRPAESTHQAAHRARARPQRPERLETSFPHVFHIFAGFPQRLSFPLAFFERDRVRYALPYVPAVR